MATIRVLLAQDDDDDANLIGAMLRDSREPQFEVDWVSTYEAAHARMTSATAAHDVVLLVDPFCHQSALGLLLSAHAEGRTAPVIVLTRQSVPRVDEEAMRVGAADYLVRDELTAPHLRRALRHAVQRAASFVYRDGEARMIEGQRLEGLGRLATGIAHDFNNLLTGIIGFSSMLDRDVPASHPGRRSVDEIKKSAALMTELTRQVLAYGRRPVKRPVTVDVNDVIDNVAQMLGRLIGDHVTFSVQRGDDLPAVRVEEGRLEQVILNLVLNARDATPTGGRITLATRRADLTEEDARQEHLDAGGRFVCLTVQDTGEGMSEDTLAHLFQPFYTTKPIGKGTGLGLASSLGIVRQIGGFMRVASELGQGTTITVYLPEVSAARTQAQARPEAGEAQAAERPHVPPAEEACGTETVLVVEDDDTVRAFVREALTFHGYRPLLAQDPGTALRLARDSRDPIDIALTDVVLPDMSGMHLAQRLAELRPGMKIVFMSGYLDARTGHSALPADALFLRKPFQPDDLARLLRHALDHRSIRTARA